MKNIFNLIKSINLKNILKETCIRFPFSIIILIVLSILFFTNLHWKFDDNITNVLLKISLTLISTFFFSIWIYFAAEWFSSTKKQILLSQIISIIFGILFYLWFDVNVNSFENITFFILSLSWIIWFLFFAPFFGIKTNEDSYYAYFYNISVVFLTSYILGWLLFILWSIAILTVINLFDLQTLSFIKNLYIDWAIIVFSLITPLYALTKLVKKETFLNNTFVENIFFTLLVKYISIPFIYIYFIILYVYSIKLILNLWDWPKGEVSWMVIAFSIFAYISYIFSYVFSEQNSFIKTSRKYFPYIVVPQLFILFYAIYLRINQYDLTVNRYFVVVFGLFLMVISIYFIFSRTKKLIFIPTVLTTFIIVISIWPWSVYNLPESRQLRILKSNLENAKILQNWKIIPLNSYEDIDNELSKNIYSGIEYLCNYDNCEKIKELFKNDFKLPEYKNSRNYEIVNYLTDYIKVKKYFAYKNNESSSYFNVHLKNQLDIYPLDVKDYSKILIIENQDTWISNKSSEYAQINFEEKSLEIYKDNVILEKINIQDVFEKMYNNYKKVWDSKLSIEELTFDIWKYKIIIQNISLANPVYKWKDTKIYYNVRWLLLIK